MSETTADTNTVELATELTIAWLSNANTRVEAQDVPNFLQSMHAALTNLASPSAPEDAAPEEEQFTPAVSVRKSLASKDHIISLIDGKAYKSLKRHLSGHGLTPQQYRERYGLKSDYPMVSESYSQARREMAKKIGLGRKPSQKVAKAAGSSAKARAPRKPKSASPAATEG